MFSLSEASARLVIYIIYCAADDATRTHVPYSSYSLYRQNLIIKKIMCISTSIQAISTTTCTVDLPEVHVSTHGALSASSRHVLLVTTTDFISNSAKPGVTQQSQQNGT